MASRRRVASASDMKLLHRHFSVLENNNFRKFPHRSIWEHEFFALPDAPICTLTIGGKDEILSRRFNLYEIEFKGVIDVAI